MLISIVNGPGVEKNLLVIEQQTIHLLKCIDLYLTKKESFNIIRL